MRLQLGFAFWGKLGYSPLNQMEVFARKISKQNLGFSIAMFDSQRLLYWESHGKAPVKHVIQCVGGFCQQTWGLNGI